jgi:outer membrane protein OmpA-like peptidoglycan-associated protein
MRALSERGVSSERLHIDALGEQHPLETNRTTLGRASNRRVEFHIVEQDEHRPAPEGEER